MALGVAVYEAVRNGVQGMDWLRVAAVPAIAFVLLLFVPNRWLGKRRAGEQ